MQYKGGKQKKGKKDIKDKARQANGNEPGFFAKLFGCCSSKKAPGPDSTVKKPEKLKRKAPDQPQGSPSP